MKKIVKLSFFVLVFSMFSCEDATDIIQKSELSEDKAFQTVADLQSGLNTVYASYGPDFGGNGDGDAILFNDLFTDNMKRGESNQGQGSQEYSFILQPNSSPAVSIWGNRYSTINSINRVLRAYDRIYPTLPTDDIVIDGNPLSTESKEDIFGAQQVKGQLLALRALSHFDLFEYFTEDYQNAGGFSIIKMDFVPNIEDQYERNTVAEILAFINDDITQSYDLLGAVNEGNINFININVVKALQSRVALVSGDYALSQTLTNELLDTAVSGFSLAQPTVYVNMFARASGTGIAGSEGELIFSLIRRPDDSSIASNYYFNAVSLVGNPFFEASKQLYDLYDTADVRKQVNFTSETNLANDLILIGKYPGNTVSPLGNDVPVFRLSEMLLINAECKARNSDLAGAAASIQLLRQARYSAGNAPVAPVFSSVNQALSVILLERRKEFAFEGHRYLDLKRLGKELGVGVSRLASDAGSFSAPTDLPANDYRFTLPIPQSELNANNIITQNTGYSN